MPERFFAVKHRKGYYKYLNIMLLSPAFGAQEILSKETMHVKEFPWLYRQGFNNMKPSP